MKKYNLLKVLAITILIAVIVTFIIPGSSADYSGNVTETGIASIGIWALFSNINVSLSYFSSIAVYIIAIAIFYAVLSNLKSYPALVKKAAEKFEGRESLLVGISSILFGLAALFVSDAMILLLFVPFVYQIMKELNIDKKTILASTIIASLIGAMFSIYNSTLFSIFSLSLNTLLLVKIVVFVLSICVLIFFIAPNCKKEENIVSVKEKEERSSKKTENVKKVTEKEATKEAKVKKQPTKKAPAKKTASKKTETKKVAKKAAPKKSTSSSKSGKKVTK